MRCLLLKDDAESLAMWRKETTGEKGGDRKSEQAKIKGDNVTIDNLSDGRGNARSYSLDVLSRKAPGLFKEVCAGKLSANASSW